VKFIQRRQLERARAELGIGDKSEHNSSGFFPMDASLNKFSDMEFYSFHFPHTDEVRLPPRPILSSTSTSSLSYNPTDEVRLPPRPNGPTLAYYRLLKTGNTQIRAMLFDLAHRLGLHEKPLSSCLCIDDCITEASEVFRRRPSDEKGKGEEGEERRVPFTFVRDPLTRFVMGFREVIERFPVWGPSALQDLPSSPACFVEFVRLLLLGNGGRLVERYPEMKLDHVAPASGVMLRAREQERGQPLILLRMESFAEDWARLARIAAFPAIEEAWVGERRHFTHESSKDGRGSAAAAWALLRPATNTSVSRFRLLLSRAKGQGQGQGQGQGGSEGERAELEASRQENTETGTETETERAELEAALHTRAICRMYLIDYLCLAPSPSSSPTSSPSPSHPLPPVCSDLPAEAEADLLALRARDSSWSHWLRERAAAALPSPSAVFLALAEVPCWTAPDPTLCKTRLVFGRDEDEDEDDDEEEDDQEL